jgi:ubiquinone/menaquinone biosynthesis C-methylase UbiE
MRGVAMNATEVSFEHYRGSAPENYERYFVPAISVPIADDLLGPASLEPGQRVLDIACGTGLIARLAAERVGSAGAVTGVDINPDMLAVARSTASTGAAIEWRQADAEQLPVRDDEFDVALCQLGLQFFPNKTAALREVRRALVADGRVVVSVPGPEPDLFKTMEEKVGRYLGADATAFLHLVFSLHEERELRELLERAGFDAVETSSRVARLRLAPPAEFVWQYLTSTPLAAVALRLDERERSQLEREAVQAWEPFTENGSLILEVGVTVASGVARH